MLPVQEKAPLDLFAEAAKRWEKGYHATDGAFDLVMKDLMDIAYLIQVIQEKRTELDNDMKRVKTKGATSKTLPLFGVQALIRQGDFIVKEKDLLYDKARILVDSEILEKMRLNASK